MGYHFEKDFIETAIFIISTGKANRLVKDNERPAEVAYRAVNARLWRGKLLRMGAGEDMDRGLFGIQGGCTC